MEQAGDKLCIDCPLAACDEESVYCAYSWAVQPNRAQMKVASVRIIPQRLTDAERGRRWRLKNPERYAEVRREYRARKKKREKEASSETGIRRKV